MFGWFRLCLWRCILQDSNQGLRTKSIRNRWFWRWLSSVLQIRQTLRQGKLWYVYLWWFFWRIFDNFFWRIWRIFCVTFFDECFDEFLTNCFWRFLLTFNLLTIASFRIGVPSILSFYKNVSLSNFYTMTLVKPMHAMEALHIEKQQIFIK